MQERQKKLKSEQLESKALELNYFVSDCKRSKNMSKSFRLSNEYFHRAQSNTHSNEYSNSSSISSRFGTSFGSNTPGKIQSLFDATKRGFANFFSTSNAETCSTKKDKELLKDIKKGFSCITCAPMKIPDNNKTPKK